MAEISEWTEKGATLSDVTAVKDYGVSRDFIVTGICVGQLDCREGSVWGNPFLRILKSQLERYINEQLGPDYLAHRKAQTELRKVKTEISSLKRKLTVLQARKTVLEQSMIHTMKAETTDDLGT
jgi:hypothetical protein